MSDQDRSKIIVDENWKSQVQEEKERLQQQTAEDPATKHQPSDPDDPPLPPASLPFLVTSLATQAMVALGQVPDPLTGQPMRRPNLARHHIDTLAVLREKTKGNLTDEEDALLEGALHQLRMAFVIGPESD